MFLLRAQKHCSFHFLPCLLFHSALHKYRSEILPDVNRDCFDTIEGVISFKIILFCLLSSLSLIFFFPSFSFFLSLHS